MIKILFIVLNLFFSASVFSGTDEMCFYSNISGLENHKRYKMWIESRARKVLADHARRGEKSSSNYEGLEHDWRTNCLTFKGSDDLKELLLEHHSKRKEKIRFPEPGRELNSCLLIVQGGPMIDKVKKVVLRYPEHKTFYLFDEKNNKISIKVSLVHPEIVSYEVSYLNKNYLFYRGINNWHELLQIPYFDEELSKDKNAHKTVRFDSGELIAPSSEHIYAKSCL